MADSTTALINGLLRYTNLEDFKNALVGLLNRGVLPQGEYEPMVTLQDNAVVANVAIARYTDYGDTVDVMLRVEYEADAGAGGMSFLVSTPVGSAAAPAIATFNGSNSGGVNFIVARGQGANILIEIGIVPDTTTDFDCVINYKKA